MPLAVPEVESALLAARVDSGTRFTVAAHDGGAIVAPESKVSPTLREGVETPAGRIDFDVRADAFWQVHREAPELLVREVAARVGDAATVLDLYAGAGLFGLSLALAGADVTLVEFDRRATADAAATAKRHGIDARVLAGDVRRTLRSPDLKVAPDGIVLDPPRSGAGAPTVEAMAALKPHRIVYVACDPVALARDTALLAERGYDLLEAQAFDLFPMTHHVEAIASFEPR
jgi:tRNA/tmRNA/rRNA uracil-C5-methylase (TrmA/RlmC/RlmD family)